MPKRLENKCSFQTERLSVFGVSNYVDKASLSNHVINIMTPKVTESLPTEWQNLNTVVDANDWINRISNKSNFLLVQSKSTSELVGFTFLYEPVDMKTPIDIRLGYLLSEDCWGIGIGSELIQGLLKWSKTSQVIKSITAGVEPNNIGSIKVLIKNGFVRTSLNSDGALFYVYKCL